MDLVAIREELGEVLRDPECFPRLTDAGIHVYAFDVVPELAELPAAIVTWPTEVVYNGTLAGGGDLAAIVTMAFPMGDFQAAQRCMDAAMSTPGFREALKAHTSKGAKSWRNAIVDSADNVRTLFFGPSTNPVEAVGFDFHLRIASK